VADALLPHVHELVRRAERVLLGLAGPPGVGKSDLAAAVAAALEEACGRGTAVVVGMDGFHRSQRELADLGLEQVKGAPQTFDADGFVALLRLLRDPAGVVTAPGFDRLREETVPGAVTVAPHHRLVLVEGNYLLLDGPWQPVRGLLDAVWHLHLPPERRVPLLVDRHVAHGRSPADAHAWVLRSDEANARLVESVAHRADAVVDLLTGRLRHP
jgi:pantothenate kinase